MFSLRPWWYERANSWKSMTSGGHEATGIFNTWDISPAPKAQPCRDALTASPPGLLLCVHLFLLLSKTLIKEQRLNWFYLSSRRKLFGLSPSPLLIQFHFFQPARVFLGPCSPFKNWAWEGRRSLRHSTCVHV